MRSKPTPHPPARHARLRRVAAALLPATVLLAALVTLPAAPQADPNYYEQRRIEAEALEAFRRVISLWQEEVYFELYDHGMAASRARLPREEFAQRMVELAWVPEGELNPRFLSAQYRFRTVVYITARVPYRHKFNPENRFVKEQTLLLRREDGQWKIDLVALIRSPFGGV